MQGGLSHERNACPFVKRVDCDKMKESSAQMSHERTFIIVFRQEEWLVEADRQSYAARHCSVAVSP